MTTPDTLTQFDTMPEAVKAAEEQTKATGQEWLSCDRGSHVWPRYCIVQTPAVGDKVSYGFNGDYYPDGEIVRVSGGNLTVTTSGGHRYYRRGNSPTWIQAGGTWSLVSGHRDERNPSF